MQYKIFCFVASIIRIIDGVLGLFLCWFNKSSRMEINFLYFSAKKKLEKQMMAEGDKNGEY